MTFFKRDPHSKIERALRQARPQPPAELAERIQADVGARRRSGRGAPIRLGLALAVTAAVIGATAAVGGATYATSSASQAIKAVVHVVAPAKHVAAAAHPTKGLSAARHQYHKVHMCHDKHENIEVAEDDVPAHLAEGDTLGKCKKHHHEHHEENGKNQRR